MVPADRTECRVSEVFLRVALSINSSASRVHSNGSQRSFHASMKRRIASTSPLVLEKLPRRIACLVMIPKKISTMFSQLAPVGVKWRWIRGCRSSHSRTTGWLCVP